MFQEPDPTRMTGGNSNGVAYRATDATRASDRPETWDAELATAVRRVAVLRTGFYVVVLLIALGGQVSGAMERLGLPWYVALPAVGALELGGVVVLANADVRRRLGERAVLSRVLSAGIAAAAVAFNWLAHGDHLEGGFYAGMSLLGYLVWLMNTENQRRDRLRAKGQLPPTTPAYEVVGHWLRYPWLTRRARSLAKVDPHLGLYGSLDAARAQIRAERRQAALSKVLHRKISRALDATTADIAVAVYDLDEIARRLAAQADYDGLTALIAADLAPARVLAGNLPAGRRRWWRRARRPEAVATPAGQPVADDRLLAHALQSLTAAPAEPEATSAPAAAPASGAASTADDAHETAAMASVRTAASDRTHVDAAGGGRARPGQAEETIHVGSPAEPADTRPEQARDGAGRSGSDRSRATDRTDRQQDRPESGGDGPSTTDQADSARVSGWAALHAELAPLLPAAPRRPRNTPDRPATGPASSTTDAPEPTAEPEDPPAATRRTPARTATGRARVARAAGAAGERGPIAAATRELPLLTARDLPDLVDAAASRTTGPVAVPDAADDAVPQPSAARPRQRRRDDAGPSDTARRRPNTQTAEADRA
ncbi:hypothetical protein AB0J20_02880 [Micromonospora costi]|uniref:hypothetical protein n=1 Tax=Micromonospora costi TaxID=1530042 RepID=UPI0033EE3AB5